MADSPVLHIPCRLKLTAAAFGAHLIEQGIDGVTVTGPIVSVPTDNPRFAWNLAQIAVDKGWADDGTVSRAVSDFLEGPHGITVPETPAATLRRAAAQARADAQDAAGPSRNHALTYASWLANEADRVEDGDTSTLPPAIASARHYLGEASND